MTDAKKAPTVSEEKVWMKYYSEESKNAPLPRCKAYDYIIERNKDRLDAPALHYYGADISFKDLMKRVDDAAKAFTALGIKEGDIVSFLSVAVPETIACVYALNRIGAAANTIDPRMDITSIKNMVIGSGSRILLTIDLAFPKVKAIMEEIDQDMIIVQSPATSLPLVKKVIKNLTTKNDITYTDKVIKWSEFNRRGKDAKVIDSP